MTENYPSNSNNKKIEVVPQEDDKGITSLVESEAIIRKPSGFRRLRRSFIGGDANTVTEHIIWNLLIPAAKDTVADMGSTFIDMMIFGQRRTPRGIPNGGHAAPVQGNSRFNYNGVTSGSPLVAGNQNVVVPQEYDNRVSPNQVIVNNKYEADAIAAKMQETIDTYAAVSVADLYRMVNKSPNYMDDKWGWTDLTGTQIKRVRDGVLLNLPDPKDIS